MNTFDSFINSFVDTVFRFVMIVLLGFFPLFFLIVLINRVK